MCGGVGVAGPQSVELETSSQPTLLESKATITPNNKRRYTQGLAVRHIGYLCLHCGELKRDLRSVTLSKAGSLVVEKVGARRYARSSVTLRQALPFTPTNSLVW